MTEPLRIFVGCAANNEDLESQVVLHYSIKKHASVPFQIIWMQLSRDPKSLFYSAPDKPDCGWVTDQWATPFSGFRWAIPGYCHFRGRAVYFDSDFIVMGDIAELDRALSPAESAMRSKQGRFDCVVWNGAGAFHELLFSSVLRGDRDAHAQMVRYFSQHPELVQPFDPSADWNVMDIILPPDLAAPHVRAIHYTQMHTQLQLKYALPRLKAEGQRHWYEGNVKPHPRADLQKLFDDLYEEAQGAGFSIEQYRREPYGQYHIRGLGRR